MMRISGQMQFEQDVDTISESVREELDKMEGNSRHLAAVIFMGFFMLAKTIITVAKYTK